MPNFDGATVKYVSPPTADEAKDILVSLLGSPGGVLTAEDGPGAL